MKAELVKYSCGCIGFPTEMFGDKLNSIIVKHCDDEHVTFSFTPRAMGDKLSINLSTQEASDIIAGLSSQLSDGQDFKEVKSLLGIFQMRRGAA